MSYPQHEWRERAACTGADDDHSLFFGVDGERGPYREQRERQAKAICSGCPSRIPCLNYAVGLPEKAGVWGGLNEDERSAERRRRLRRQQGYVAA